MKFIIQTFFFLAIPFFLTSCFEVTEDVSMNKDGSGAVLLTINMSESKQNLAAYLKMDKVEGMEIPSKTQMEAEILKVENTIKKIKGMSEVKTSKDFEEFIFTVSGNFDKVKTLNKAINAVVGSLNRTALPTIKKDNFSYANNRFSRLFRYGKDLKLSEQEFKELNFSARFVMESARYISVYRFPNTIKKQSNPKAQLSPSKKAVKLETSIADLVKGNTKIENTIDF